MGSYIELTLGDLSIDWGKNDGFYNHGTIFEKGDLCLLPYDYVDDDGANLTESAEATRRPLAQVVDRLELLGFTSRSAKQHFLSVYDDGDMSAPFSPLQVAGALQAIDLRTVPSHEDAYTTQIHTRLASAVFVKLAGSHFDADERSAKWRIADILGHVEPYALLRLLADNPVNLGRSVCWRFADVVAGGWVDRRAIVDSLGGSPRFLVVTEGNSDSLIIERVLRWLKPRVADFFSFIDMKEGYPFTGVGNVYRFCQGLKKINIENQIVIVYDNDAAGIAQYNKTLHLNLPSNFAVMRLPDHPSFCALDTIGPNGEREADINGRAASIECYLDLTWGTTAQPVVRWGGYVPEVNRYQGKLIGKQRYAKRFLKLKRKPCEYDMSKLGKIADDLIKIAISVAESR